MQLRFAPGEIHFPGLAAVGGIRLLVGVGSGRKVRPDGADHNRTPIDRICPDQHAATVLEGSIIGGVIFPTELLAKFMLHWWAWGS